MATRNQDATCSCACFVRELGGKAALADSRLAHGQHETPGTPTRRIESGIHLSELALPTNEDAARDRGHARSSSGQSWRSFEVVHRRTPPFG
jgi:hypothetical protein